MRLYDLSRPIYEGMPVWREKPEKAPAFTVTSDFVDGQGMHETRVALDVHTGTHVDAPLHALPGGKGVDAYPLQQLIGEAEVLDLKDVSSAITATRLRQETISTGHIVLLKTRNSNDEAWHDDFVYLAEDGARYLAEQGIAAVGIDALGIERDQPGHPTHKILLGKGILIIEGLLLGEVPCGTYEIVVAPLRLIGCDAAPARVLLVQKSP